MDSEGLIRLAHVKDIPEGTAKLIPLQNGEEIALFHIRGEYYALSNSCPHMGGPLCEGEIEDCKVTCPWHGWQFDLSSGECINCPGDDAKAYPLVIQGDEIFIQLS
jgi:nitrite reductase (NADH) small subunit